MATLRRIATADLIAADVLAIRAILDGAFGTDEDERFTDDDWDHALGGIHFVLDEGETIVGHAAVVERRLELGGRPVRTGYVEAVAVAPSRHGRGLGSVLMADVNDWITNQFELGALGTGRHAFYERLGWVTWRGPSSVRTTAGERRTPGEDGFIMVLRTPASPAIDVDAPISCDWRPGDVW
jgi:aminoglycoside 2'-N-acetyltransferase I